MNCNGGVVSVRALTWPGLKAPAATFVSAFDTSNRLRFYFYRPPVYCRFRVILFCPVLRKP